MRKRRYSCVPRLALPSEPLLVYSFRMRIGLLLLLALPSFRLLGAAPVSGDWPQFLGPTRNGVYQGPELAPTGCAGGDPPPVRWKKTVGHGFGGPVVAQRKLVFFHRLANRETVECLDALNGTSLWKFSYPTMYEDQFGFDDGPRATPSIAGARIYTFGAEGMLHCLDFQTG